MSIPPNPTPTNFTCAPVKATADDGTVVKLVMLSFSTCAGTSVYFWEADAIDDLIGDLQRVQRQVKSGLIIPNNDTDLLVPPSADVEEHRKRRGK